MPPRRTTEIPEPPSPVPDSEGSADAIDLGYVSGVFGVRGEVRLFLHNPDTDLFARPRRVTLVNASGQRVAVWLSARSGAGKRVLGRMVGVDDPDAAAAWMDWRITIPPEDLPALDDDEFYYWQLEGLAVWQGDQEVGRVVAVHATPGGDLLEVDLGDDTAFVPALERFVTRVDLAAGRVELAPDALEEG